jgi:hypothetical protein
VHGIFIKFKPILGECLVWRVRTTGWFWLVKTKLELGLIFGPEFRTGTKVSIFSKTRNQTKPKLGILVFQRTGTGTGSSLRNFENKLNIKTRTGGC